MCLLILNNLRIKIIDYRIDTLMLVLFKYSVCTIDFNPLCDLLHNSKIPLQDLNIVNKAKLVHVNRLSSSLKLMQVNMLKFST